MASVDTEGKITKSPAAVIANITPALCSSMLADTELGKRVQISSRANGDDWARFDLMNVTELALMKELTSSTKRVGGRLIRDVAHIAAGIIDGLQISAHCRKVFDGDTGAFGDYFAFVAFPDEGKNIPVEASKQRRGARLGYGNSAQGITSEEWEFDFHVFVGTLTEIASDMSEFRSAFAKDGSWRGIKSSDWWSRGQFVNLSSLVRKMDERAAGLGLRFFGMRFSKIED
ncbi:MAG: hypothetical protein KGO53_13685 [Alphaproteobacteria bacterium]|nr:hypothetical protein [Alphaproteobacteria bacterium]